MIIPLYRYLDNNVLFDFDQLYVVYPSPSRHFADPGFGVPRSEFFGIVERPFSPKITGFDLLKRTIPVRCHLDKNAKAFGFEQWTIHDFIGPFFFISAIGGLFLAFDYPSDTIWMETYHIGADCQGAAEIVVDQYITNSSSKKHFHANGKQFRIENLDYIVLQLLMAMYRTASGQ